MRRQRAIGRFEWEKTIPLLTAVIILVSIFFHSLLLRGQATMYDYFNYGDFKFLTFRK